MQVYVGYGFSAYDIQGPEWGTFLEKYDRALYEKILKEEKEPDETPEEFYEYADDLVTDYDLFDVLARIINQNEKEKVGEDVVVTYNGEYIVFDSIGFVEDSPRAEYIRSSGDFQRIIGRYINTKDISFGNLWEGNDFSDPCYYLE